MYCMYTVTMICLTSVSNTLLSLYIDGLVQDCINFIANALQLPQSCTKPLDMY